MLRSQLEHRSFALEAHLAPTSVSLVLRVSALARRMLPGPFEMPLFVSACSETGGVDSAEAGSIGEVCGCSSGAVRIAATEVVSGTLDRLRTPLRARSGFACFSHASVV